MFATNNTINKVNVELMRPYYLVRNMHYSTTKEQIYTILNEYIEIKSITLIPGMCETSNVSALVEMYNLQDSLKAWEFITIMRKCKLEGCNYTVNNKWVISELLMDVSSMLYNNLQKFRTEYIREISLEYIDNYYEDVELENTVVSEPIQNEWITSV